MSKQAAIDAFVAEHAPKADVWLKGTEVVSIETKADFADAVRLGAQAKRLQREVEAHKGETTGDLRAELKGYDAEYARALKPYKASYDNVRDAIAEYVIWTMEQADAAYDDLEQSIVTGEGEECAQAAIEQFEIPKVPGLSLRIKRKPLVTDNELAVRWCVDNNRLDLLAMGEVPDDAPGTIDGVTEVVEVVPSITEGKVEV